MRDILSRANRAILERFAWSNVLLAFDYDGTLAPIVDDPAGATMRGVTARLLAAVTRRYPVAVISGRARADVASRLGGAGVHEIVGNHGIEARDTRARVADQVERWLAVLRPRVAPLQGVDVEHKRFSLAIHYRRSRARREARAAILDAAAGLADARVIGGKLVVNLLPQGAPHKGMALVRERTRMGCDTAVYVGDDDTDEDVFSLDQPGRLLSIRVGRTKASAASYFIRRQAQLDDLLRAFVELRQERALRTARGG